MPISFGTDGWRGVISDTFTFYNVRLVSQAIADAVAADDWLNGAPAPDERRVVVGFDTRFLSDRFAVEAARVLAGNGIKVYLTSADVPTPTVSHAVRHLEAMAGIMITASHNAPRYNGVKLKASYGGAAAREQCRRVEFYFNNNESRGRGPNLMDFGQSKEEGLIERFNPTSSYHDHLRTLIDFNAIAENPQHVAVDSMFGSGRGQIKGILQGTGCEVNEVRGEMNPGFGGIHPEPIARYLGALAGSIAAGHGQLGLATDGDADRIGAMDGRGEFVDPHRLMALALKYLVEQRGWSGKIVKTVSTTQMINRLGEKYGLEVIETPIGFDHIADLMLNEDVLIGGEESGGISFKGHIPEGDGIHLVEELLKDVGPSHYGRLDLRLTRPVPKDQLYSRLVDGVPKNIGELKVERVSDRDGVKFHMGDDSWLLIRPSGTEPLLRIYAEAREPGALESLLEYGRQVAHAD
jgi:phosphomannomutase